MMIQNIIFQAYQTFTEFNETGMTGLWKYPAQLELVEFIFTPLLLITLFIIVLLTTYFSQVRLRGSGDFFASFASAGYFTIVFALVLSLIDGMINTTTLSIAIAVAVIGTLLLLISRR